MSRVVLVALAALVSVVVCEDVLNLDSAAFTSELASSPLFVKFYAPWCGHCKNLAPTWEKLATEYNAKGGIRIAKVDCTQHKELCSAHGVRGYPTLKLFTGATAASDSVDYNGGRSLEALSKWVDEQGAGSAKAASSGGAGGAAVPDKGLYTATASNFKATIAKTPLAFVKFYAPWCGHCKRLAPTWDELAEKNIGSSDVKIVKVDCTVEASICSEYEVRGYPTLILFKNGVKGDKYAGARTLEALSDFLADQGAGSASASGRADGKAAAPAAVSDQGLLTLTDDSFDGAVAKGYSFVKFYAPWCGHCKRLAPTWDDLAESLKSKPINIGKVDCTVHSAVCGKYEVRGYPTLLLFKDGKKVEKYSGARALDDLKSYVLGKSGHDEL